MSHQDEIKYLKAMIEMQASRIQEQEETIKELRTIIDELRSLKANLEETIQELNRKFFGISSEKTKAKKSSTKDSAEDGSQPKETVQVKGHTRTRKPKATRDELYKDLPIHEEFIPLDESEQFCDWCNSAMIEFGKRYVREEIRILPAKVIRVHYYKKTYICPACKKDKDGSIKHARVPEALIPHSVASASLVTQVIFEKSFLALPYYRQELAFEQLGAKFPRETLANWLIIVAEEYLYQIYEMLHRQLLLRDVIHADETTCQVLREDGKDAESTSYFWIYRSGSDNLPEIILYEYQPGRGGIYPKEFLEGFHGILQCDGYQGYNKVEDVKRACCMAHCRRKFFEALPPERKKALKLLDINSEVALKEPEIPQADLDKYIPAEIGVAYCNKLFYLEREFKDLSNEKRKNKRLEQEVPVWESFWNWIEGLNTVKGGKLEKAVNYALNHRESLCTYLEDGRCELSNNAAERNAKSYAIIRKNSLFHTSVRGATASSIILSLVETAKANNLNVFQYIYFLLLYLPGCKSGSEGIEHLMPWSDFIKEHCSGLIDVENVTVENHPPLPEK